MVTQRIFNTRLLTYLLISCLLIYPLPVYLVTYLLFTYLFTFNGHTLFLRIGDFCASDIGKTTWSAYDGIVMHCIVHNNTVIDRPRGFATVARTKVPRLGTKGCGREM